MINSDRGDEDRPRPSAWHTVREGLADIVVGLADIQMRTIVTTKLAPVIYVVCALGVAGINAYLAALAFGQSLHFGLIWLLLVMPVMLLAGMVIVRVVLEVILSIFRIVVDVELMMEQVQTLRGRTDEIVEDLPRIQFWRGRKRYSSVKRAERPMAEDARDAEPRDDR